MKKKEGIKLRIDTEYSIKIEFLNKNHSSKSIYNINNNKYSVSIENLKFQKYIIIINIELLMHIKVMIFFK